MRGQGRGREGDAMGKLLASGRAGRSKGLGKVKEHVAKGLRLAWGMTLLLFESVMTRAAS